ncbi:hypothetical protein WS72_21090 [Burkholderia savannae]|uniref:Uncharacterized protein n=1 Tax=Burkholderia savannae TaxID=1637837 RepID=A0ABR5T2L1_9BURK|nr:hypothetical protein WS72_21090 [Burkholderia savannae]
MPAPVAWHSQPADYRFARAREQTFAGNGRMCVARMRRRTQACVRATAPVGSLREPSASTINE